MKPPNSTPTPPAPNQVDQQTVSLNSAPVAATTTTPSIGLTVTTPATLTTTSTTLSASSSPNPKQMLPSSVVYASTITPATISTSATPTTTTTTTTTTLTNSAAIPLQLQTNINITPIIATQLTTTNNNSSAPTIVTPAALIASQPTIMTKPTQTPQVTPQKPVTLSIPHMATNTTPAEAAVAASTINVLPNQQEQQAPLALTTQSQYRRIQVTKDVHNQQPAHQQQPLAANAHLQSTTSTISKTTPTTTQLQHLNPQLAQTTQLQCGNSIITTGSPITLATAPTTTGPTALVIIPQHSTTTPITPKAGTITTKTVQIPTTLTASAAHAFSTTTTTLTSQSPTIQMQQAPVNTIVSNLAQVPMTAHQNTTLNQTTTLVNRPPQTLPVVPITTVPSPAVKHEPNRYTCCLFDNGIRCERVAGNASFSARIQKIVGTKKMNYTLDQAARHSYICDHHKAIITVAKKSTTIAREPKSNARNYTATNNANAPLGPQHTNNLNELAVNQPTMQHQMNLELLSNQSRLVNNHTATVLNNMPMRQGAQIAYGHFPGPHTNQIGPMDTIMTANYDNTGGDNIPSNSGGIDVDLQQLQVNTLRRYKRHFRVQTRPGLNKMQLAESLKHHFRTLPIIEKEAITYFVYIVKCSRNKLDHNPKAD